MTTRLVAASPRGVHLARRGLSGRVRPHPLVQLQRAAGNAAVAHLAADALPLRGSGAALELSLRQFMEPRLGCDLGGVRVHANREAAIAARALGARAFTIGHDIVFEAGEYQPHSTRGRGLLAHELAHVAQQGHSRTPAIQRQQRPQRPLWERQLDDLLPLRVGLVTHIMRTQQLFERFSEAELSALVALIHANADARRLTNEFGVPGIFALQDTRVGNRLDVPAARFLLTTFPTRRRQPRASQETRPEVFPEDVVRDAYIRFHFNALLPKSVAEFTADLPAEVRRNCIAIVHEMVPRLFADPGVVRRIQQKLAQLRQRSVTHTMVHTGEALTDVGVSHSPIVIRFKDAQNRATNGNTEPVAMTVPSAWDAVTAAVGNDFGWHIFGVAVMDGHHSVTLFVDNQPDGRRLFWADQWFIDRDFQQMPGGISGFREYNKAGFDGWVVQLTNQMWNHVHSPPTTPPSTPPTCGDRHPTTWDSSCRYNATLRIWHLRRVAPPTARRP